MLPDRASCHEGGGYPGAVQQVAVLMDREGRVAGMYRKVHVAGKPQGRRSRGGLTPGRDYPVFQL